MIRQFHSWLEDMHPISYWLRTVRVLVSLTYISSVLRITATINKTNMDHFVAQLGTDVELHGGHHPFHIKVIHLEDW